MYTDEAFYEETRLLPGWLEFLLTIIAAIGLAVLVRVFVAETFAIPSGSMLETIQLGDRVLGEKLSLHWRDLQAGDVVTFADPDGSGATLIKRVIATEGQTVDLREGVVYVDDVAREEPYTGGMPSDPLPIHASNLSDNITFPYVVPQGCIWVMGDNRGNSLDSRYFGAVPLSTVSSRAICIYWPPEDMGAL